MLEAGIAKDQIDDYLGDGSDEEPFEVYPGNAEALDWFLRMNKRWVVSDNGTYLRLDDQALKAQMDMRGVKRKRQAALLDALMLMESAALEVLNEG